MEKREPEKPLAARPRTPRSMQENDGDRRQNQSLPGIANMLVSSSGKDTNSGDDDDAESSNVTTISSSIKSGSEPGPDGGGKLKAKTRGSTPTSATLLPRSFKPTPYSVIIGRGKEAKNHGVGNRRLKVLVSQLIPQYASAINRPSKTKIVDSVVSTVREACATEGGGSFVKLGKDGRWYEVGEAVAREKVGYTFREMLGDRYRSSSQSKVARKHQLKEESQEELREREQPEQEILNEETTTPTAMLSQNVAPLAMNPQHWSPQLGNFQHQPWPTVSMTGSAQQMTPQGELLYAMKQQQQAQQALLAAMSPQSFSFGNAANQEQNMMSSDEQQTRMAPTWDCNEWTVQSSQPQISRSPYGFFGHNDDLVDDKSKNQQKKK